MNNYNIRFAKPEDISSIMVFIDEYWKRGHILSRDRVLFEWQYLDNDRLNMVIGESEDGSIQGILGYIPYADDKNKDFSLALWKAKPGTAFLGVKLLMFLFKEEPHRKIFCNGINLTTTAGIYQRLDMKIGKLTQYYRLCSVDEYKIAKVTDKVIPEFEAHTEFDFKKVESFAEIIANSKNMLFDASKVPYKSKEYIAKRYFNHPAYEILAGCNVWNERIGYFYTGYYLYSY